MKYRKKPVEVEAMQFKRDNFGDIVKFTNGKKVTAAKYAISKNQNSARLIIF